MQFQIKSCYDSDKMLFTCELSAEVAGQAYGLQLGFAVKAALSARADLAGAYLARADLAGANLAGANLAGANLAGAYLFDENITKPVTQLLTEIWPVIIGETKIKIGCQLYTIAEWEAFSDDEIEEMNGSALGWWRVWKAPIMAICKATGKTTGEIDKSAINDPSTTKA